MLKFLFRSVGVLLVLLLVVSIGGYLWVRHQLTSSLPQVSGSVRVTGITSPVRLERDDHGIPVIRADNRNDLAFGTGFAHGQDRFFQMDVLRRAAAGELAELFGPGVISVDKKNRQFRFRDHARSISENVSGPDRLLVAAYVKGVNAGLESLGNRPFEYLVLGDDPKPWTDEDVVLVALAMFIDLQGNDYQHEIAHLVAKETLPAPLFEFLLPVGNDWDAPIDGSQEIQPEIPGPEVIDLRAQGMAAAFPAMHSRYDLDEFYPGSNNWAVAGSKSAHGGALLANDMHLRIGVPNIWYRASFSWPGADGSEQRITGATLPGTPVMVVGSNGHVAWGFTNSEGDWTDVVIVELDPADKEKYLTPEGSKAFEKHSEVIKVRGQPDQTLEVVDTIWGPILGKDPSGRPLAVHWVANTPEGVNFGLGRIESAKNIDEAMELANEAGAAEQNFVVADKAGNIGWTILGRIPRRIGADGQTPVSWADGTNRWDGYLQPDEYPRIKNPESGRIWTANARVVGGEMLKKVGVGRYDLGARAKQIRDDLIEVDSATEADMLKIQLDDRAVFLAGWQKHMLEVLSSPTRS
jgi:penicillin amidase